MIAGITARLRSLWRGVRRRADTEADMSAEFRHHLELRTEDLIQSGVHPREAARQARLEFGHIDALKEDARASRGLRLFDEARFSWLDVKLGARMLMKYPGLSLISMIGMSVAIAIGVGVFGLIATITDTDLPLPEGHRVVSILNWDVRATDHNPHALHDFLLWKDALNAMQELGAFRDETRNLLLDNGRSHLVQVAEMTASGFRLARVSPVLGRPLLDDDEREGAPPVVVIAYEQWQRRFDGDAHILGRPIRLGSAVHAVVGVMPQGFRFPISHEYWIPLRLNPSRHARGSGPSIHMFGRLADGVTVDRAQQELTTLGLRTAAEFPRTNEHVRPRILPYTYPFMGLEDPARVRALRIVRLATSLLLVLVAVNVSVLVYARTATRTGEIAVRSALGASRRRIVTQLFVEALVLSLVAAAVGLAMGGIGFGFLQDVIKEMQQSEGDKFPFWIKFGLSGELVVYAFGLAVLAGLIVGVLPALKATGRRMQANLQQLSSRGSQMQLGRTWTALIVAQVAVAVAVLPFAVYSAGDSLRRARIDAGHPTEELLGARLVLERLNDAPGTEAANNARAFKARFVDRAEELRRRLEAEPAVSGVTFETHLAGYPYRRIEVEGTETFWAFINRVDVDLFPVFDVPIQSGRGFTEADARGEPHNVIVNRVFAEQISGSGNVLGRRFRYVNPGAAPGEETKGPWLEIVGVVPDYTVELDLDLPRARVHEPVTLADVAPSVRFSVRIRGSSAAGFGQRLREIAGSVDPGLQLHDLRTAAEVERQARRGLVLIAVAVVAVVLAVLLLSAAGIYAMMAFTVARRTREIGIRSALGADSRRLLRDIFARASAQLGAGVLAGLLLAAFVRGPMEGKGLILLPIVAALMMAVGLVAALGPARRGLAIQPTEALREE